MNSSLLLASLTGLSAGIIAAVPIYLTAKRKIKQHVERINHEMQNLRYELNTKTTAVEIAAYEQVPGVEELVYESNHSNLENDFSGSGGRAWDYVAHRFSNDEGEGSHNIENGVITISRSNTVGRYELHLKTYHFAGQNDKVPADSTINKRNLRLSCEVKKGSASHILRFVFKGESHNVLDEKDYVVFNPWWEKVNLVFTVSAHEASYLRIDDLCVLEAPSYIQLRNIVLNEKRQ